MIRKLENEMRECHPAISKWLDDPSKFWMMLPLSKDDRSSTGDPPVNQRYWPIATCRNMRDDSIMGFNQRIRYRTVYQRNKWGDRGGSKAKENIISDMAQYGHVLKRMVFAGYSGTKQAQQKYPGQTSYWGKLWWWQSRKNQKDTLHMGSQSCSGHP